MNHQDTKTQRKQNWYEHRFSLCSFVPLRLSGSVILFFTFVVERAFVVPV